MTILSDLLINGMIKDNMQFDNGIDLNKLGVKITILSSRVEYNHHVKYEHNRYYYCKISYNNFDFNIGYHDSVYNYKANNKLDKVNVLYCALMDMRAYDCSLGVNDFINEFGYDDYKKGLKIYNALSITSDNMHKMFTNEELETLDKIFENY